MFWCIFCTISESFRYKFSHIQYKKKRKLCRRLLEEYVAAFCFKNTPEWLQMSWKNEIVQHILVLM